MHLARPTLNETDTSWGTLLGGGAYQEQGRTRYLLSVFDLTLRRPSGIPTSFLPHGIAMDPRNTGRLVLFEKIGPGACEVDLQSGAVTRTLSTAPGHAFYGHGAFSSDGSRLYATETAIDGLSGAITVRDGTSLELLGAFPSHGHKPHDCQLIDHGKVMVIANAGAGPLGEAGCLNYVDVENGRLLEQSPLPITSINAGHFAVADNGDVALISAPRDGLDASHCGGVSLGHPKQPLQAVSASPDFKHKLKGETLSVALDPSGKLALTCSPTANLICAWDLGAQTLLKAMPFDSPRGITLSADGTHFMVAYGSNAAVIAINVDTLSSVGKSHCDMSFLTGSHIWNWQREHQRIQIG